MPASVDSGLPAPAGAKAPRRVGGKLGRAIDFLVSGECKTIKAAAARAGMARETLSRQLGKPHVQAELQARVDRLVKGVSVVRAAAVLDALLDASSEHVRLKAAELVLAMNGHRPPPAGVNVQVNNSVGYIIDLREPIGETHQVISGGGSMVVTDAPPVPTKGEQDANG